MSNLIILPWLEVENANAVAGLPVTTAVGKQLLMMKPTTISILNIKGLKNG